MDVFFESQRDSDRFLFYVHRPNNNCLTHFHSNLELTYVESGAMESTINGETHLVPAGGISITNPFDLHACHTPDRSDTHVLLIPVSMVPAFCGRTGAEAFADHFLDPCPVATEVGRLLKEAIPFSEQEYSLAGKGYAYVILGLLVEQLGRASAVRGQVRTGVLRQVLAYVDSHCLEHLTLQSVAAEFGYHPSYLSDQFNRFVGCGFRSYVNLRRAWHAADLLEHSDMSLDEVAAASGFTSMRTFRRSFENYYHLSPGAFRKKR